MLSAAGWMALAVTCYNRSPKTLSFLSVLMQPKYMDQNLAPNDELRGWSKLMADSPETHASASSASAASASGSQRGGDWRCWA